jgi:ribose 5-phosphate isomerase B
MKNIICLGCDHAGFELKEVVKKKLSSTGDQVKDFGTHSTDSVDYPDFVHPVAEFVGENKDAVGILICGSANGVAMAANKHEGVRAAVCWNKEVTALARKHNDANILCLPARFISSDDASAMIELFLNTSFEGGRHEKRVKKISPEFIKQTK